MPEDTIRAMEKSRFRNGSDIHFDYDENSASDIPLRLKATSSKKKKKKRGSKNKSRQEEVVQGIEATLNNPDEDYPTSRVIRQGPDGNVIVESLDDNDQHPNKSISASERSSIWDNASVEEQENLKKFWESLDEPEKLKLVKIDKPSIMELFRDEIRSASQSHHVKNATQSQSGNSRSQECSCRYCGRTSSVIENELENIYDNHFDDIIDFIHEVRDISDLNALPGLLFGGFHVLEQERKLQKRQEHIKRSRPSHHNHGHSHSHSHCHHNHGYENLHSHFHDEEFESEEKSEEKENDLIEQIESKDMNNILQESRTYQRKSHDSISDKKSEIESNHPSFDKIDPKLLQALEGLDLEKVRLESLRADRQSAIDSAISLRDLIRDFRDAEKAQSERRTALLEGMGTGFNGQIRSQKQEGSISNELSQGLSKFAEDLLKNDGNTFIDMLESLSDSKACRDDFLRGDLMSLNSSSGPDGGSSIRKVEELTSVCDDGQDDIDEVSIMEDEDEDYEDYDESDDHNDHSSFLDDDQKENVSDTESEISEEEKMQEIRRLFLIQVIKLFQERLKNAYKDKLSRDRTQMLIAELEAEENAKKEKELKKLKQKEKAKEKKRLLQLAKEEERKRKDEAQRLKEKEERESMEALKAEQKRRKEEAKQKRDELKKKKLDEYRKKEEEQRKKAEATRDREQEARRLKEERKRLAQEERKKKEEERARQIAETEKLQQRKIEEQKQERDHLSSFRGKLSNDNKHKELQQVSGHIVPDLHDVGHKFVSSPDSFLQEKSVSPSYDRVPDLLSGVPSPGAPLLDLLNQKISPLATSHLKSMPNGLVNETQSRPSPALFPNSTPILPNKYPLNSINSSQGTQQGVMSGPWSMRINGSQSSLANPPIPQNTFGTFHGLNNIESLPSDSKSGFTSSVWNPTAMSRSSSIWGNGGTGGSIWSNNTGPPVNRTFPDIELLQLAISNAFQMFQNSNLLEFGMVQVGQLYQQTKVLLDNDALSMTTFLNACQSSSKYNFERHYDELGKLTHIKVTLIHSTQAAMTGTRGVPNDNTSLLSTYGATTDSNTLLNSLEDNRPILSPRNNPGSRSLWN